MLTARFIINKVDGMKQNTIDVPTKMGWLYALEYQIQRDLINTHENPDELERHIEHDSVDPDVELIGDGYDSMYIYWLCAQIDEHYGDMARYANDMELFNAAYGDYTAAYNRKYLPVSRYKIAY